MNFKHALSAAVVIIFGSASQVAAADDLQSEMLTLDQAVFDSFNRCSEPGELDKHAAYFASDIEFYHDNGGVTWDRDTMINNTKKNVCGNFYRKLLPETFSAFAVKDFGAITRGTHIFCSHETQVCEGKADFNMVWKKLGDDWEITRVLSYGHREN